MSAHVQETEGTASAMVDTAPAAESDRLGDALVELETDGIACGDLALTVAIHGPLSETESLDGDIRRIFARHAAKVIREGYGQLPAWFSRMPAQPRRRQVRSVFVSAGAVACMTPVFGPPVGSPQSPGRCPPGGRRTGPPDIAGPGFRQDALPLPRVGQVVIFR